MSAGYDPNSPEPGGYPPASRQASEGATPPAGAGYGAHAADGREAEPRPGPRPPWADRTAHPLSTYPPGGRTAAGPPTGSFPAQYQPGATSTGQFPAIPHQTTGAPGYAPYPAAASGVPYQPASAAPYQPASGGPAGVVARIGWPALAALALAVILAGVAGIQAYQLDRLGDRVAAGDRREAQAQAGDAERLTDVEKRAGQLEQQAGRAFNPEAIATAVVPSVFRVRAGDFTGTAFAVGRPAAEGGTNLFTNFHVVEQVWKGGGREVSLERKEETYPATIVRVDEGADVALLRTTSKFAGLVTATAAVKAGQQIVVVGAPLGLTDSVTTGVVSAFRRMEDGSGTVIQFDAPINPGNSGGPVINSAKQVVGIATAKARNAEGIGLAVPIKIACDEFKVC